MRYVTHQFAHSETLDRARRWLIHAGIAPDRMQVRRQGVPRLAVVAESGEVDSIEMVIHAAEMADPDALPSFWDLARIEGADTYVSETVASPAAHEGAMSFVLAWQPADAVHEDTARSEVELQRTYRETRA